MSQQKEHVSQNSRLDKFLFYSKFAMLVIVAILFLIAYSFFQRDLPISSAHSVYPGHTNENGEEHMQMEQAKILFVITTDEYQDDSYSIFYKLNNIINDIPNCNYDIVLFKSSTDSLLNNINDDLLTRVNQDKHYQYIISLGDSSVNISKDIKDLFFPSADIYLYSSSFTKISETISSVTNIKEYIKLNVMAAKMINHAEKFVFLCSEDLYSSEIIKEIRTLKSEIDDFEYTILYSEAYTPYSASSKINDMVGNTAIFYVSFESSNYTDSGHIIEIINTKTQTNIYDLSTLHTNININDSLRLWPLVKSNEPLAYLGITQESRCAANYEFIDYIAGNIINMQEDEVSSIPSLIYSTLNSMGIDNFPENLDDQLTFCIENSLTFESGELTAGDLIFTSPTKDGAADGVYIYINENMVIDINEDGIISFTKPKSYKYPVAYASPCNLMENAKN